MNRLYQLPVTGDYLALDAVLAIRAAEKIEGFSGKPIPDRVIVEYGNAERTTFPSSWHNVILIECESLEQARRIRGQIADAVAAYQP